MFAYIKNGNLMATSEELITKREEHTEIDEETGETQQIITEGMEYDEVIQTKLKDPVCYENEKLVPYEDSALKKRCDAWEKTQRERAEEEAQKKEVAEAEEKKAARPTQILQELGELKNQRDGLIIVEESTEEVDTAIEALKTEYQVSKKAA